MLSRQVVILRMLSSERAGRNRMDLVKLLFLLSEEHPEVPAAARHEFLPYHRGPYSFTLAYDLRTLERGRMLVIGDHDVAVTPVGRVLADGTPIPTWIAVTKTTAEHGGKTTAELVDYVYENYHWYTLNSVWAERRKAIRPIAPIKVYTTGYEGLSVDGLLNRLLRAGVRRLIDVRENPVARRYGFHKSTLIDICRKLEIGYVHVPDAGVPSVWRSALDSTASYSAPFKRYQAEIIEPQPLLLDRLVELVTEEPSALMCKEADPTCCHRSTLAVSLGLRAGLEVVHLGEQAPDALF